MNGNYQLVDLRKETESESGTEANKEIYVSLKRAADRGIGVLCLAEAGNFFSTVEKAEDGTVGVSVVKATATTSGSDTVWTATAETHTFTAQGVCSIDSVAIVEAPEPTPAEPELPIVEIDSNATADELWDVLEPLATANRSICFYWEGDEATQLCIAQLKRVVGEDSDTIYLTWEEDDTAVKFVQWTFVNASDTITKTEATYTLTADV